MKKLGKRDESQSPRLFLCDKNARLTELARLNMSEGWLNDFVCRAFFGEATKPSRDFSLAIKP
jgi:hypothetical protein